MGSEGQCGRSDAVDADVDSDNGGAAGRRESIAGGGVGSRPGDDGACTANFPPARAPLRGRLFEPLSA